MQTNFLAKLQQIAEIHSSPYHFFIPLTQAVCWALREALEIDPFLIQPCVVKLAVGEFPSLIFSACPMFYSYDILSRIHVNFFEEKGQKEFKKYESGLWAFEKKGR